MVGAFFLCVPLMCLRDVRYAFACRGVAMEGCSEIEWETTTS